MGERSEPEILLNNETWKPQENTSSALVFKEGAVVSPPESITGVK